MVVSETSKVSATSGTDNPPKKRRVTTWAGRGCILRQSFEGLVEGDHVQALLIEAGQDLVQGDSDAIPVALPGVAAPGVIDQDLAHRLGGGGEEVAAVGDVGQGVAVEEPQHGLVDQGAGLEGVAGPLAAISPPAVRRSSP